MHFAAAHLGLVEELSRHVTWMDAVVPVAVEFMALEIDAGEVGGGDFDAGRIRIGVDLGTDLEAGFGGGGGDQLDNDLMADERFAAPVLGDEREEAAPETQPLPSSASVARLVRGLGGSWRSVP